jgi:hypothetical protein
LEFSKQNTGGSNKLVKSIADTFESPVKKSERYSNIKDAHRNSIGRNFQGSNVMNTI